ncbi:hypothetical protein [Rubritalea profundi]|uniref:Uncharacterized protein n=1 Tax=Rubritalea profundi TaxID=1658618 RepID=A0A2S7U071_9BACT|nr:hypothetical protein [Rubritalea profundi]PQJ27722.1 hypothetical protein BSZ32_03875 [Rubritalea profundi]
MQQEISAEKNAETEAVKAAKEEDSQIWERQNFMLGCDEMERITDDVIVPVFSKLARAVKDSGFTMDIILMDCESPLDKKLYNVGVRLNFEYHHKAIEISIVADPSDFTFTLSIYGIEDEIADEFNFHEVVPLLIQKQLKSHIEKHFPEVEYTFPIGRTDAAFEKYSPPYRVQYDDNGNVSDVATTQTLHEAANMGSTFAKMFKKEDAITVIDANDAVIC